MSFVSINNICCNIETCEKFAVCKRAVSLADIPASEPAVAMVNPNYVKAQGICPLFITTEQQNVARGFIGILSHVPAGNARKFKDTLISHFGRKYYYQMRKGERPINEMDQMDIINVARECGVKDEYCIFDKLI